jgi:hypothetical protein
MTIAVSASLALEYNGGNESESNAVEANNQLIPQSANKALLRPNH